MNYYFLPKISDFESSITLVNFPCLERFPLREERRQIYATWPEGNHWFYKKVGVIEPRQTVEVKSSQLGNISHSSFVFFHYSNIIHKISAHNSHLTERGYIAYYRKGEPLKSFCHGNLQALSKVWGGDIKEVAGVSKPSSYYAQLSFSDCAFFELIYTAPSFQEQKISIEFYDNKQVLVHSIEDSISALGCKSYKIDNAEGTINTVRNTGNLVMWRPIIFKYYTTHFDVLHG